MSIISKDLMAACSIPLILSIIKAGDTYGYEIMQKIRKASEGNMIWKDGSLYPVLKKLEQRELIRSQWNKTISGKRRKYYSITMKGRNILREHERQWMEVNDMLQGIWSKKIVL